MKLPERDEELRGFGQGELFRLARFEDSDVLITHSSKNYQWWPQTGAEQT
jgi:hypothetical protein